MRKRQKLVWSTPQAARAAQNRVTTSRLGHFTQPAGRPIGHPEPEVGSMWKTSRPSWIITGAWEGTELFENLELEGEDIAYISPTAYRPSEKGQSRPVPAGAIAVYLGSRRITEWDGKGWARPTRMTYLVDGMLVAAVSDIFMPL